MNNHIDHIEITNFKSICHQKIEGCKRINVFIGYPNVGKSNILEAIGLYGTQIADEGGKKFTDFCRVELIQDVFYNQDYRKIAEVLINDSVSLKIAADREKKSLILETLDLLNQVESEPQKIAKIVVNFPELDINLESIPEEHQQIFGKSNSKKRSTINSIKKYIFNNSATTNSKSTSIPLIVPFGNNLMEVILREVEFRDELSKILKRYDLKLFIDRERDSFSVVKELGEGTIVSIAYNQIADTLRRLIFHKAAIVSNQNSILIFEEPEAHMFPPYIRKFTGDIIFDKGRNNQYFISTHSPFVIGDFLEDARGELSVYLVGLKNGETVIKGLSDEELEEVYGYGVDLFFNIESYLD